MSADLIDFRQGLNHAMISALALHATAAYIMYWAFFAIDDTLLGEWIHTRKGQRFQFLTIQG